MAASPPVSAAPQGLPTTGTWNVEPHHSTIAFRIIHHGVSTFRSAFDAFECRFDADADVISGSVDVQSVRAFPMLRDRLFEADFFDVGAHPTMTFASTAIERSANQVAIEGDLTIRGITRPVRAQGIV